MRASAKSCKREGRLLANNQEHAWNKEHVLECSNMSGIHSQSSRNPECAMSTHPPEPHTYTPNIICIVCEKCLNLEHISRYICIYLFIHRGNRLGWARTVANSLWTSSRNRVSSLLIETRFLCTVFWERNREGGVQNLENIGCICFPFVFIRENWFHIGFICFSVGFTTIIMKPM